MIKDDFERKFQQECKIVMIICLVLIVLVIGVVVYSCHQGKETDRQLERWDQVLQEAEK